MAKFPALLPLLKTVSERFKGALPSGGGGLASKEAAASKNIEILGRLWKSSLCVCKGLGLGDGERIAPCSVGQLLSEMLRSLLPGLPRDRSARSGRAPSHLPMLQGELGLSSFSGGSC